MTHTMSRPARWLSATGLGIVAAWTLTSCGTNAPELTEVADSAQQAMDEASSISYSISDPDNVADETPARVDFSGQLDEPNFELSATLDGARVETRSIDDSTAFMKYEFEDDETRSTFGMDEEHEGLWIEASESDVADIENQAGLFDDLSTGVFNLIDNLTDEELEAVEIEETELDGQSVYKYTVPATGEVETEVVPGADTVAFYFVQESSELLQLDGSSADATMTVTFSDYDNVEPFEAPAEDEISDLDWEF